MKLFSIEKNIYYPPKTFSKLPVKGVHYQKHFRLTLDSNLNFNEHFFSISSKVDKLTVVLQKLQTVLPRLALLTLYKAFIGIYKASFRLL